MRLGWLKGLLLFLSISCLEAHEQDLLQASDINHIMHQIFNEHVNKKEMTGTILQNALLIYIQQFDPEHIYLLESEVIPFSQPSPEMINQAMEQYKRQDLTSFKALNRLIQNSIERSRQIRTELELEKKNNLFQILPKGDFLKSDGEESFAQTRDQLKDRIKAHFASFVEAQKRRYGEALTTQRKEQILNAYRAKMRDFENQYLYIDEKGKPFPESEQENLFTIHVLKALANSLDSHTTFYQANEAYDIRVHLQKEFKGIGLILRDLPDGVTATRLIEGGPAARSKAIEVGDVLIEIDGKSVKDLPFDKVMGFMHDDKNAQIKLTLKRKGNSGQQDKEYTVELKKEMVTLNNDRVDVSSEVFGNGIIGKITLHSFYQGDDVSSEKDVRDAIKKLEKKGNLKGLILDLRDNSGGFLSQAVKVAGLFITNGVIVISKYANGEERFYRDVDGKTAYDGPLVVLTSKATASAAEIVAQALQDYGVAIVVGDEHTYGKGTIQTQTVTDNQSTSYFKVTVGKYYTVSGQTPQGGVKADVVAPSRWHNIQIGEGAKDGIKSDKILPAFDDQLNDLAPDMRSWYLKYYTPSLQRRITYWRDFLPTLRRNSEFRIAHNKNYQYFLKGQNGPENDVAEEDEDWLIPGTKSKTFGENDLQMQEAVSVLKDMILLNSLEKNHLPQSQKAEESR